MSAFTGIRPLLVAALRQNVRGLAPWVAGVTGLAASSILAYDLIFPDQHDRAQLAAALGGNPALALIFGPARNLLTADGFNAWRSGMLGAFLVALMAIFAVVRNSRADEDSGQAELLASGVMGRATRLTVAVLIACAGSLAAGLVSFCVTVALGGDVTSTLMLSATFVASGVMFAAVAAVAAQLASSAGPATSIAVATLGAAYLLRGFVDTAASGDWPLWLSPLGWLEKTRPAIANDPWPLLAAAAFAISAVLLAFALQARRDFGQGLIAPRPGPARAGLAAGLWGMTAKLNRDSVVSWSLAFVALGLVFGFLVTSVADVIGGNPAFTKLAAAAGGSSLVSGFLATMLQLVGLIAATFGAQVALRIYAEEVNFRVEPLLAGSLRRSSYLTANAAVAFAAPTVAFLLGGVIVAIVVSSAGTASFGDAIAQAVVTVPAVWVLIALALAGVGARPAVRLIGWVGIAASFALTLLGPTFNLPNWALGISPLHHVPNVTADTADWPGLAALLAVAVGFTAVAFAGFRRRDIL